MTSCWCIYKYHTNADYIDIYNLSVILLELSVRDVFLKVHIYFHRAQCISGCLYYTALANKYLHVENPLLKSGGSCLLTFAIFFRCSCQSDYTWKGKSVRDASPLAWLSLSLIGTHKHTHTITHAQITHNHSCALTHSSWAPPPPSLSFSHTQHVRVGNTFIWPRPPMGPQSALTDTHITAD